MDSLTENQKAILRITLRDAPPTQTFQIHQTRGLIINGADVPIEIPSNYTGNLSDDVLNVKNFLVNEGFAALQDSTNIHSFVTLNDKGRELKAAGSFEDYEKSQSAKMAIADEEQELTSKKLKLDVKNAGRIYSTYWWTFGMAVLALLISLALLILKLKEQ